VITAYLTNTRDGQLQHPHAINKRWSRLTVTY
jgi:hypothetical protein